MDSGSAESSRLRFASGERADGSMDEATGKKQAGKMQECMVSLTDMRAAMGNRLDQPAERRGVASMVRTPACPQARLEQ
jgi:hypothetical protein